MTTTRAAAGHFEVDFYHTIYQMKMGQVKGIYYSKVYTEYSARSFIVNLYPCAGHFGPVNTLSFSPDGKSYASGAEDGYIRLHHFDKEYFSPKNN